MQKYASFLLSFFLHAVLFFIILFWPTSIPLDLGREVYQVSLVMGDPGGEGLASSVLGARPEEVSNAPKPPSFNEPVTEPDISTEPTLPATQALADVPTPPKPEAVPNPIPLPESNPVPIPVPEPPKEALIPEPPKPEPKPEPPKPEPKPEPPKPEPKPEPPKPEPPKPEPAPEKQPTPKPAKSAVENALAGLSSEPAKKPTPSKSSAASSALADLQKQTQTSVGGGAGTGTGPGGGGIYDVYIAQVMLLVQKNWSMPTYSRENYVAQIFVRLDPQGRILETRIERSSGRADFDASAVNTLIRIGTLPPPPTPAQQELILTFNSQS